MLLLYAVRRKRWADLAPLLGSHSGFRPLGVSAFFCRRGEAKTLRRGRATPACRDSPAVLSEPRRRRIKEVA